MRQNPSHQPNNRLQHATPHSQRPTLSLMLPRSTEIAAGSSVARLPAYLPSHPFSRCSFPRITVPKLLARLKHLSPAWNQSMRPVRRTQLRVQEVLKSLARLYAWRRSCLCWELPWWFHHSWWSLTDLCLRVPIPPLPTGRMIDPKTFGFTVCSRCCVFPKAGRGHKSLLYNEYPPGFSCVPRFG